MNNEQFLQAKMEKAGSTLKGIAGLVTQSFEIEAMTGANVNELYSALSSTGKGFASSAYVNDGNGWNSDVHHDCSLASYDYIGDSNYKVYGTETSSSPLDTIGYANLKAEIQQMLDIYKVASKNKVYHTVRGSVHVHNTVSYKSGLNSVKLDVKHVFDNVGRFMIKFMPVMKWLTMTDIKGARGVRGSSYGDQFSSDGLFSWWSNYSDNTQSDSSFSALTSLGRGSCFRAYSRESVHFENRLCDSTFNATHLAMWLSLNKAMTLFAIDFTRNGFTFPLTDDEVAFSRQLMRSHANGYKRVNRDDIDRLYKEMISYLAKYLKIINSLDAIDVMDKLVKCPISQYLDENNIPADIWNMEIIEKVFNTRNRASDDVLRDRFMHAVKSMSVPFAEGLNEYLENLSTHLDVEVKKVKSLYQMFKRENVDIEFLGGRLVYLGD
jgi:hypothetical protein